jgi:Fe-S-cluster-containing dehydrogenase component/formate-dependent nitrite reductase membrane component NrfD
MKYGFIIDNRKCIGCHACTTACKAEHDVPVGVNRTWVKQVEKGEFPHTRRLFSVMRCNHCTDAPCVEICPVEALFIRDDGIVDFDKNRCIGCKSCMQACPYDALYIDPDNHTAAKCNYCAHRVDLGLEPACVNVCPEHAIISGDMDDPESEIAILLSREQVSVRKAAKGTVPNLFYIDGDESSLNPIATDRHEDYYWNEQSRGVGHFAKNVEKLAYSNENMVHALMEANGQSATAKEIASSGPVRSIDLLMKQPRRIYDTPDKGILWGWEVPAYVVTKAISSGAFLVLFMAWLFGWAEHTVETFWWMIGLGLVFLSATGLLLIKDLDRPDRFLNVLLRPQWNSWLVRGGYSFSIYGAMLALTAVVAFFKWEALQPIVWWVTLAFAMLTSVYTAFLFAQAKGRDFWQSPAMVLHMLVHSFLAGAAAFTIVGLWTESGANWLPFLKVVMLTGIALNLATILVELTITHPTQEAKKTVHMILHGRYRNLFWWGAIVFGNILPLVLLAFSGGDALVAGLASLILLIGIYFTEKIWVEAPQRIPLV